MAQHKAGRLKQQNKKHKTPGGTRPSRENALSGRTAGKDRSSAKQKTTNNQTGNKQERLNRQKQLMQEKRLATIRSRRQNISNNSRLVVVIPLSSHVELAKFPLALAHPNNLGDWEHVSTNSQQNRLSYYHKQQKCQVQFFCVQNVYESLSGVEDLLQIVSVADSLLFLVDYEEDVVQPLIDETGKKYLDLLAASGSPLASVGILSSNKVNPKNPPKQWKAEFDYFQRMLATFQHDVKIFDSTDSALGRAMLGVSAASNAQGGAANGAGKVLRWKSQRSYFVTETVAFDSNEHEDESKAVRMTVTACLRGVPLSVHSLVHICGVGVARIASVSEGVTGEGQTIEADRSLQDSLQFEALGDDLAGEQTWPTAEEQQQIDMLTAEEEDDQMDRSENGDETEGEEGDEDGDDEDLLRVETLEGRVKPPLNAHITRVDSAGGDGADEGDDDDYVEVPGDMAARTRFARYRALQSFRSSYWHPHENLPPSYRRVFQLEDFKGMQKRLQHEIEHRMQVQLDNLVPRHSLSKKSKQSASRSRAGSVCSVSNGMDCEDENDRGESSLDVDMLAEGAGSNGGASDFLVAGLEDTIRSDQWVTMVLEDVPRAAQDYFARKGYFVMYALYPHENKLSVTHYNIRSTASFGNVDPNDEDAPRHTGIKSKTPLLFYSGFRSFWTRPIFSENNLNCDKHKFLRYLPSGEFCVASCLGPVMTAPAPLLMFRTSPFTGQLELVATGTQMTIAPERIVLKRAILWGSAVRVHKKTAVVKHMFYDPLDAKYFKPAELVTDRGARGHILSSVGTHGLFKVHFNTPITQQDTIQLVLYKRIYPKFPDNDCITVQ